MTQVDLVVSTQEGVLGRDPQKRSRAERVLRRKRRVSHDQSNSGTLTALKRRLAS